MNNIRAKGRPEKRGDERGEKKREEWAQKKEECCSDQST